MVAGSLGCGEGLGEQRRGVLGVGDCVAQQIPARLSPSRTSSPDRWLIVASQRPITLGANTAPTQTAAWKTIPSWAVVGTEDRVIPPATQRSMAERAGSTITEVAGSHVSMVSHPGAAIDAILAAVAAIECLFVSSGWPDLFAAREVGDCGVTGGW